MRFVSISLWAAFGTLIVLATAIGIVAFQNQQASAANGEINGTVTDRESGAPLPNICVTVYDAPFSSLGSNITDSSGAFTVAGLPTGDVKVEFQDCGTGAYLSEWYDDQPDFESADVTVIEKSEPTSIVAALTLGGSINGTVIDEHTGALLPNICVTVYDGSFSFLGTATTDSLGQYTVIRLPSGDVKVEFEDCNFPAAYLSEWYQDEADFDSADPVPVTEKVKTTPDVDAALTVGGSINGTVTDREGGAPSRTSALPSSTVRSCSSASASPIAMARTRSPACQTATLRSSSKTVTSPPPT